MLIINLLVTCPKCKKEFKESISNLISIDPLADKGWIQLIATCPHCNEWINENISI